MRIDPDDDYPRVIRMALQAIRREHPSMRFEAAWQKAQYDNPPSPPWSLWPDPLSPQRTDSLTCFMFNHFRAAWHRDASPRGRIRLVAPDVPFGSGSPTIRPATPSRKSNTCRSGDGCARPATHGRFGPTFCETHWLELSRLTLAPYEGHVQKTAQLAA